MRSYLIFVSTLCMLIVSGTCFHVYIMYLVSDASSELSFHFDFRFFLPTFLIQWNSNTVFILAIKKKHLLVLTFYFRSSSMLYQLRHDSLANHDIYAENFNFFFSTRPCKNSMNIKHSVTLFFSFFLAAKTLHILSLQGRSPLKNEHIYPHCAYSYQTFIGQINVILGSLLYLTFCWTLSPLL